MFHRNSAALKNVVSWVLVIVVIFSMLRVTCYSLKSSILIVLIGDNWTAVVWVNPFYHSIIRTFVWRPLLKVDNIFQQQAFTWYSWTGQKCLAERWSTSWTLLAIITAWDIVSLFYSHVVEQILLFLSFECKTIYQNWRFLLLFVNLQDPMQESYTIVDDRHTAIIYSSTFPCIWGASNQIKCQNVKLRGAIM